MMNTLQEEYKTDASASPLTSLSGNSVQKVREFLSIPNPAAEED